LTDPFPAYGSINTMISKYAHQQSHIGKTWYVVQCHSFARQKTCDHKWQGSILRPGDWDEPLKPSAATNANPIHKILLIASERR
jgi:hypothetical protein